MGTQAYLVPNFNGDDDTTVSQFLECLQIVSHISAWTETQTLSIARLRLSGSAAEYVGANPHILDNYSTFAANLKRRFTLKVSPIAIERMFTSCLQLPLESVNEFSTRLRKFARKLKETFPNPNSDATNAILNHRLLAQFLLGLREELGRFVIIRNPKTVVEAEELALNEEANVRNYASRAVDVSNQYLPRSQINSLFPQHYLPIPSSHASTTAIASSGVQQSGDVQAIAPADKTFSRESSRSLPSRKCYKCGRLGHISRYCRSNSQCFQCGATTHIARECTLLLCGLCKESGHRPIDCPSKARTEQGNLATPAARSGTS
jgi:hypothetical protein